MATKELPTVSTSTSRAVAPQPGQPCLGGAPLVRSLALACLAHATSLRTGRHPDATADRSRSEARRRVARLGLPARPFPLVGRSNLNARPTVSRSDRTR
jgi:hypothetical protein